MSRTWRNPSKGKRNAQHARRKREQFKETDSDIEKLLNEIRSKKPLDNQ